MKARRLKNVSALSAFQGKELKIGIGLPATIPNTPGSLTIEWSKRAEKKGFSTLGIIDRVVYPNYEPLITLSAAAGATEKIGLMTTIMIVPTRDAVMTAKQIATLDVLSGGRLVLGFGLGSRADDMEATNTSDFKTRGRRMGNQVRLMKRIWAGEKVSDSIGAVGPAPFQRGGPPILLGGNNPNQFSRIARWADGYIASGGGDPKNAAANYEKILEAWNLRKRQGKPRFVSCIYYSLGENFIERGAANLRHYYAIAGPYAEIVVKGMRSNAQQIKETVKSFSAIGVDELIFWPAVNEIEQLDALAELLSDNLR
jgi:alkanesulfonate monooxygenase SsuD/methylene tetrahydromethanopterin reductase-like flavin-dependent oxidoreductase (luciferase family)